MEYGTWYGKNLEEYTKKELLEIIVELGKMKKRDEEEFSRDLSFFSDLALKRRI